MKAWLKIVLAFCAGVCVTVAAALALSLLTIGPILPHAVPPQLRNVRVEVRPALYFYTEDELEFHLERYLRMFAGITAPQLGEQFFMSPDRSAAPSLYFADYIVFSVHALHRGSADALQRVWINTPQHTRLIWANYNVVKYTGGNENWIATAMMYAGGLSPSQLEAYIRALTLDITTSVTRHGTAMSTTCHHHVSLSLTHATFVHESP
ncbi:MAG: hypothetical protein FWB76_04110 [Oscillospiraceae bacterium]|nr:hypothetical protein [Oscillospiraceae bacterium]